MGKMNKSNSDAGWTKPWPAFGRSSWEWHSSSFTQLDQNGQAFIYLPCLVTGCKIPWGSETSAKAILYSWGDPKEGDSWTQSADHTPQNSKLFLEVESGWHITMSTSFQPLVLLGSASPYMYVEQQLHDSIKHFFLIENLTKGC